ncbi:S-layer homology domain-containing protein [Paenibacillus arenilitoris]|nr:S-layer homology domain-containing protein [Paenibacillus arenilitoris]
MRSLNRITCLALAACVLAYGGAVLAAPSVSAEGGGGYRFERMTPEKQYFFEYIQDIAADGAGKLYVAMSHGVEVYSPEGELLASWDAVGFEEDQDPVGISPRRLAVDADGFVYVYSQSLQSMNDKMIYKLDVSGGQWPKVVGEWNGAEQFDYISGLAADSVTGSVYAADPERGSVWVLDNAGGIGEWGAYAVPEEADRAFVEPIDVAVDGDGNLFVIEEEERIVKLDGTGQLTDEWKETDIILPGPDGPVPTEVESLTGIAAGADGYLYAADESASRLIRFDADWSAAAVGENGYGSAQFSSLSDLAVFDGGVYAADTNKASIQKFGADLGLLDEWGKSGDQPGYFLEPGNIAIDREGNVLAADRGNERIQLFDNDLRFIAEQVGGDGFEPSGVAVDAAGLVYITSGGSLYRFNRSTGTADELYSGIWGVADIAIDRDGILYATSGSSVLKLDQATYDPDEPDMETFIDGGSWNLESIAIDRNEGILYATNKHTIAAYGLDDGEPISANWDAVSGGSGDYTDLAVDAAGNLYVTVASQGIVYKLAVRDIEENRKLGEIIDILGGEGTGEGEFEYLYKIAIDPSGNVFAADRDSNRLQKFEFLLNQLADLTLSAGELDTEFDPQRNSYTAQVSNEVSQIAVTPTARAAGSVIRVNGEEVDSGGTSAPISLAAGTDTVITVAVEADDGQFRSYSLTVSRTADSGGDRGNGGGGGGSDGTVTAPGDALLDEAIGGQAGRVLLQDAQASVSADGTLSVAISRKGVDALLALASRPSSVVIGTLPNEAAKTVLSVPASITELSAGNPQAVLEFQSPQGLLRLPLAELARQVEPDADSIEIALAVQEDRNGNGMAQEHGAADVGAGLIRVELNAVRPDGSRFGARFGGGYARYAMKLPAGAGQVPAYELAGIALDESGEAVPRPVPTLFGAGADGANAEFWLKGSAVLTVWRHAQAFEDGGEVPYAADAIRALSNKFVLRGVSEDRFMPKSEVTRAQFITMMIQSLGIQPAQGDGAAFADVTPGQWHYDAIMTAYGLGLANGYEDGRFQPGKSLSRQEMVTMLYNALKFTGQIEPLANEEINSRLGGFEDEASIAAWAREAVAYAVKHGIVRGTSSGTFSPDTVSNRAQGAMIIHGMMRQLGLINS